MTRNCRVILDARGFIWSVAVVIIVIFVPNSFADLAQELDTVVVTATRIAQRNYKIVGNVTVITADQIAASNAQNIPELLSDVQGVNIYAYSTAKTTLVDIRGFGDTSSRNVLVLVNGRKINSTDMSGPDLLQVPLEAVERVEIIRGAGSVLYGDNAVGGIVNIITKKGEGKLSGKVGTVYGSYDRRGTDLEISGASHDISYFLYSKYFDDQGYRQNSDVLAKDLNTRLDYDFSDILSTSFNFGWHEDDSGLPGGLNSAELRTLGRRGSPSPEDFSSTKDRFVNLGFHLTPWQEEDYVGELVLDLSYRNRDVYDEFNEYAGYETHTKRSIDTTGIAAKYIFDHLVFNKEVNFVTGIDYYDHENDILGSATSPDDLTISKEEFGIYGFLQYEFLKDLFVNGGTRYHKADYAFSQRNVAVDTKQSPDEWVSMGGMKYEYAKGSNLHWNVQQTFRFLATDEWYSSTSNPDWGLTPGLNTGISQQTGIQYEMGLKHNFHDAVIVNVTPYWMDLNDEIFFDPVALSNSNYDKTRRVGVEFGDKVDLLKFFDVGFLDKLEFSSDYTYQDPQFLEGANDGKDIPMAPRHQAGAGLTAEFWKHYNVSLKGEYVGSRFAINDVSNGALHGTSAVKPYYTLNTRIAYTNDNLELYAAINNLLDEPYAPVVVKSSFSSTQDYYPAPERNFNLGMKLRF